MKNLLLSFLIGIALTTTVYAIEPNQEPPCCDVTESPLYEPNDEDEKLIIPEEAPPNEFVIMLPMTCRSIPDMVALLKDKNGAEIFTIGTYDATRVLASDMNGWLSMWGTVSADEICVPNWGAIAKPIYLHSLSPSNATYSMKPLSPLAL